MSAGGSCARGRSPAHLGTGVVLLPSLPLPVPYLLPPGESCSVNATSLVPGACFPPRISLDPQAVCAEHPLPPLGG